MERSVGLLVFRVFSLEWEICEAVGGGRSGSGELSEGSNCRCAAVKQWGPGNMQGGERRARSHWAQEAKTHKQVGDTTSLEDETERSGGVRVKERQSNTE